MNVICITLIALAAAGAEVKAEENKDYHRSAKAARALALEKRQPCVVIVYSNASVL